MQLIINGQPQIVQEGLSLSDLIAQLNMKAERVAVERNGAIVPRNDWPQTTLQSGDRLEITWPSARAER
ncbi:MAG: thiamine biosynthesis protein ThiS [Acidobacteria bacterium]|nr:MAG: thiamine biosynthesis protein ThiS [Acidobacteriota bacterium]